MSSSDHHHNIVHSFGCFGFRKNAEFLQEIGGLRAVVLALLLLGHLLFSIFAVTPGHFVSDEGIYHQMAKAFAERGALTLDPEYGKFPSPELRTWNHLAGPDGSLQSQYPYLHPVLAWPFYELAGFRGLFAINAVAYAFLALACFLLAERMWHSRRTAADALILLTLGSYAWQYSQEAWSQMLAAAFLLWSIYFGIRTVQAGEQRAAMTFGLAAGLLAGLGAGVRLDVIFIAPALFAPLLYDSRPRLKAVAAVLAGLLPGLILLSLTNYAKFGSFQPISYGRSAGAVSVGIYLPLIAVAAIAAASAWLATRETVWPRLMRRWRPLAAGAALVAAMALLLLPGLSGLAWRLLRGTAILVTDLSLIDPAVGGLGITRGPTGAIMYSSTVKKALLQSLPWLPLVLLPLFTAPRVRASLLLHATPVLTILAFLALYGWSTWHGGYAFNLRYFLPLLPVLAIYGAKGLHILLAGDDSRGLRIAAAGIALVSCLASLFALYHDTESPTIGDAALYVPLYLAAGLMALLFGVALLPNAIALRRLSVLAAFTCFAWAFTAAMLLDLPRSWLIRQSRFETGVFLAHHIPENALLFLRYDPASFALTETRSAANVWVNMDDYADAPAILQAGLAGHRPVYAFFDEEDWVEFTERGMRDGLQATAIAQQAHATLYALTPQ